MLMQEQDENVQRKLEIEKNSIFPDYQFNENGSNQHLLLNQVSPNSKNVGWEGHLYATSTD